MALPALIPGTIPQVTGAPRWLLRHRTPAIRGAGLPFSRAPREPQSKGPVRAAPQRRHASAPKSASTPR
ncbi:unnamed protein product [Gadus morhua 'NCC']